MEITAQASERNTEIFNLKFYQKLKFWISYIKLKQKLSIYYTLHIIMHYTMYMEPQNTPNS